MDERVLLYPVGGPEVMREQIERLVASASRERPIQIGPDGGRTYHHLNGPFVIATYDGRD